MPDPDDHAPAPAEPDALPIPDARRSKGWHPRGYLPHVDIPGLVHSITFRLGDSLPTSVIQACKSELGLRTTARMDDPRSAELRRRIARFEDAGHGCCALRGPRIAHLVEDALLRFDAERYRLLAWCVMPNHVHALIETCEGFPVPDIMHNWKGYTAKAANRLLERRGPFWGPDYFDRFMRDERHLRAAISYIHEDPVKAGLMERAEDWEFSSADPCAR